GDPAALPHLSDTLDTTNANNKTQITELVDAIKALGGTLTKRQQKLWDRKVASDRAAGTRKSGAPTIFRLGKPGAGLRL
ncbi:MAG: hypothetical protein K2Z81_12800, partial [Cyanobacteria bacterium]|nr:hypothetical protein [Cyanobacteriota bacterium]